VDKLIDTVSNLTSPNRNRKR